MKLQIEQISEWNHSKTALELLAESHCELDDPILAKITVHEDRMKYVLDLISQQMARLSAKDDQIEGKPDA